MIVYSRDSFSKFFRFISPIRSLFRLTSCVFIYSLIVYFERTTLASVTKFPVHNRTPLISSSLLLQEWSANLVLPRMTCEAFFSSGTLPSINSTQYLTCLHACHLASFQSFGQCPCTAIIEQGRWLSVERSFVSFYPLKQTIDSFSIANLASPMGIFMSVLMKEKILPRDMK